MGLLDGKVACVTGAGRGIGRSEALALAKEGAKVVVNDLGGTVSGAGMDGTVADQVVKEIKEAGGSAVANHSDAATVEGADSIIWTGSSTPTHAMPPAVCSGYGSAISRPISCTCLCRPIS